LHLVVPQAVALDPRAAPMSADAAASLRPGISQDATDSLHPG
jgi:hypothetical protein